MIINTVVSSFSLLCDKTTGNRRKYTYNDINFVPLRCIHLSIDPQERFYEDLSNTRQTRFPSRIKRFASVLERYNIPTLWVAYSRKWEFIRHDDPNQNETVHNLGLYKSMNSQQRPIFTKADDNAFWSKKLSPILQKTNIDTIILSGMNTRYCVSSSLQGGIKEGFNFFVVDTMLADNSVPFSKDNSPYWHRNFIISNIDGMDQRKKVNVIDERTLIHALRQATPAAMAPTYPPIFIPRGLPLG